METVQIVLDKKLLQAADRAARQTKLNRSALVREALREHLRRMKRGPGKNATERVIFRQAQANDESHLWEMEAAWPAE